MVGKLIANQSGRAKTTLWEFDPPTLSHIGGL